MDNEQGRYTASYGAVRSRPQITPMWSLETVPRFQTWPTPPERAALVVHPDRDSSMGMRARALAAGRRFFDIGFAAIALLLSAPVSLLLISMIRLTSEGPAIYKHRRVGQNGKPFDCLKFRTMVEGADEVLDDLLEKCTDCRDEFEETQKLKDDPRITRVGKLLRRTSLDELPQFWNVLRGDMGVVGPRPIVDEEKVRYGKDLPVVLSIRPGLTGLWQVSGRNDIDYEDRVALDRDYVVNRTPIKDAGIIVKTVTVMFKRDGAY